MFKSSIAIAAAAAVLLSGAMASDLYLPEAPLTSHELSESRGGALLFAGRNFAPFRGFEAIEAQQDFDIVEFFDPLIQVIGLIDIDSETLATANSTEPFESLSFDPILGTFVIDNGGRNNISLENGFSRSIEIRDFQAVRDVQNTASQIADFALGLSALYAPSSF